VIDISIFLDPVKIINTLNIKGHSGFREKEKDIVCAGVSALVNSFDLSLKNLNKIKYNIEDGDDYILNLYNYPENLTGELKGLSMFLIVGLKAISKEYSDNVKFNLKRS
jgi:uncharacterized protein YsxB (DUF464 family)